MAHVQGSELQQEWFEVLFKRHHVMHFPWGENPEEVPLLSQFSEVPLQNKAIDVTKLYHVTHKVQEEQMFQEDENCYVFKPKQKHGRCSSGRKRRSYLCLDSLIDNDTAPDGETEYRLVLENESLFPGFLSWWSIDIDIRDKLRYNSPSVQQDSEKYYVTYDFKEPPFSCYGDIKLSIDLLKLLCYYQEARSGSSDLPRISIHCGGTLCYKREIMKVIIVCCKDDLQDDYPLLDTPGFSLKYDDSGKVSTTDDTLTLTIKNGIENCSSPENTKNGRFSWDTYGFAFYFPTEDCEMKCDKNDVTYQVVEHEKVVGSKLFFGCLKKDSFDGHCPSRMPPEN